MSPQYQNLLVLLYLCRDIWLTVLNKNRIKSWIKRTRNPSSKHNFASFEHTEWHLKTSALIIHIA